jgi:hypothetical protein
VWWSATQKTHPQRRGRVSCEGDAADGYNCPRRRPGDTGDSEWSCREPGSGWAPRWADVQAHSVQDRGAVSAPGGPHRRWVATVGGRALPESRARSDLC